MGYYIRKELSFLTFLLRTRSWKESSCEQSKWQILQMTANIFKLLSLGLVQGQWYGGSDVGGMTGTSCTRVCAQQQKHESVQGPFVSSTVGIILAPSQHPWPSSILQLMV